ncbi:MAG: glycosyltransferase family 39 protein [Candidatus Omnitrophica bacterium]|nr:glycosyltransferase family 39 protein [Candidatus Omnitrophota bacterium]
MGKRFFYSHLTSIFALLVLAYFFLMLGNGSVSLTHPDEVFYIDSAKEMLAHNSWFTPMIFDHIQFEKPFLAFAMFMTAIKAFGLNPAAARFFPALFAIIGVMSVYGIAIILFRNRRVAFLSGLVLATSFIYMALARAVLTDMIFTTWVSLSTGAFCLAYYSREKRAGATLAAFVFMAAAVLTKGLLGICFPLTTLILFLIYQRDLKFLWQGSMVWGFLLMLALAVPWHVMMYQRYGDFFLYEYFGNVHIRRLYAAEHPKLNTPFFYPGLMFAGIMPWSLFWFPAAQNVWQRFQEKSGDRDKIFFLLAWMLAILAFIQPAASKLASYVFPLFPAVAIFIAYYLDRALSLSVSTGNNRGLAGCGYAMSLILWGIAGGGILAGLKYPAVIKEMTPVYITAGAAVVVALLIFTAARQGNFIRMIFFFPALSGVLLLALFLGRPYAEPWVSCQDVSRALLKEDTSGNPVIASKFYVRGVWYYTGLPTAVMDINGEGFWSPHPIPFLNDDKKVLEFLLQQKVTFAVVKESNSQDLKRILANQPFRSRELYGKAGKYILRIEKQ